VELQQAEPAAAGEKGARVTSDARTPLLCPACGEAIKLVKTIPHLGGLPEIFVFYCPRCKQAETKVQE
jgi:Zn finger protein HypA/HybF involved in hydrogenase expression